MPIAAGRHNRADLDELLSNVSAPPADGRPPRAGAAGPCRLFSHGTAEGPRLFGTATRAGLSATAAVSKLPWQATTRADDEHWASGAALETLASVDTQTAAKPADVSLRCITPQLAELIQPAVHQPEPKSGDAAPTPSAAESSAAAHRSGAIPLASGAVTSQPRTAKPPISSAGCREIDPVLARVIEAWPKLPRAIQAAIRTLAETGRSEP
jgi:hypothetical protein